MKVISRERFQTKMRAKWCTEEKTNYSLIIGAGFARSAGMPMAETIAGILAHAVLFPVDDAKKDPWQVSWENCCAQPKLPAEALAFLTGPKGPTEFRYMPYNAVYETLFQDDALFAHEAVSRRAFLEALAKGPDGRLRHFNFESIYLAEVVERSRRCGGMLLDTLFTTNFDDVLENGFAITDITCKSISDTGAIDVEPASTAVPRIIHAHGHYSNYYLVNTTDEFKRSRGIDPKVDKGVFDRSNALRKLVESVASTGGLITAGYAGWDDVLMDAIRSAVENNCFPAGIYWCTYGKATELSPNVAKLSNTCPNFFVVERVSAMDVVRDLISAQALEEGEILETTRRRVARFREFFDQRTIQIEQKRHGLTVSGHPANLYPPAGDWSQEDITEVIQTAEKALWSGRLAGMALELIDALFHHRNQWVNKCEGELLRCRGLLRQKYCAEMAESTCDLHRAIRLNCEKKTETYCGLARNYMCGGDWLNWKKSIDQAKNAAKASKNANAHAAYKIEYARWLYFKNKISNAEALLKEAIEHYSKTDDFASRANAYSIYGSIEMFCNNHTSASSLATAGIEDAKRADALNCLGDLLHVQGRAQAYSHSFRNASDSFERSLAIAEEGPYFPLLANVLFSQAEMMFRFREEAQCLRVLDRALHVNRVTSAQFRTKYFSLWKSIYSFLLEEDWGKENAESLFGLLEDYDKLHDYPCSVEQWKEVYIGSLIKHGDEKELTDFRKRVVMKTQKYCSAFHREMFARVSVLGDRRLRDPDARILTHVEGTWTLVELLEILINCKNIEDLNTYVSTKYGELASGINMHGHATGAGEAFEVCISAALMELGVIDEESMRFVSDSVAEGARADLVSALGFLEERGYWEYVTIVERRLEPQVATLLGRSPTPA